MSLAQTRSTTATFLTVTNVNMSYQTLLTGEQNIMHLDHKRKNI